MRSARFPFLAGFPRSSQGRRTDSLPGVRWQQTSERSTSLPLAHPRARSGARRHRAARGARTTKLGWRVKGWSRRELPGSRTSQTRPPCPIRRTGRPKYSGRCNKGPSERRAASLGWVGRPAQSLHPLDRGWITHLLRHGSSLTSSTTSHDRDDSQAYPARSAVLERPLRSRGRAFGSAEAR
jgi:hypothetical protein